MLSLTAQPLPMMKTLKAAIRVVSGDVIFDSAYPAVDSVACSTYCCDVLSGCATKLGFKKLAARFRDDGELLKVSVAIVRSYTSACGAVVDVGIILAQHPNLKHSHRLQRCCKHQNWRLLPFSNSWCFRHCGTHQGAYWEDWLHLSKQWSNLNLFNTYQLHWLTLYLGWCYWHETTVLSSRHHFNPQRVSFHWQLW